MLIDLNYFDAAMLRETANRLGAEELLGQLCEECGELIQAAQKVRRAMRGTTPVSMDDALVHLNEECADVALCIDALSVLNEVEPMGVQFIGRYKSKRWFRRVCGEAGQNDD